MTSVAAAPLLTSAAAGTARTALFAAAADGTAEGANNGPRSGVKLEDGAAVTEVIDLTSDCSPPARRCGCKVKREESASAGSSAGCAIVISDDECASPRAPRLKTEAAKPRVKIEVKAEAAAAAAAAPPPPPLNRRQKRSAFVNALPGAPRPIVRLGLRTDGTFGQTLDLASGLSVYFPFPPAPPQLEFMNAAAEALMQGRHGLLEAPTGTGKTMALLAAACGYQHAVALAGVPEDVPVIFFVARTLNQLNQSMRELRSTAYRMIAALLASRDALCRLPAALKPGADRAHECEKATYKSNITCAHLQIQENIGWPAAPQHLQHFLPGGYLETADIEDLVKRACPRYLWISRRGSEAHRFLRTRFPQWAAHSRRLARPAPACARTTRPVTCCPRAPAWFW